MFSCIPLYDCNTSYYLFGTRWAYQLFPVLDNYKQVCYEHLCTGFLQTLMIISLVLCESCSVLSDSLQPHGLNSPGNSPGQNTGVGSLPPLQEIFLIQGSNPGLQHCRWIPYQLSHRKAPFLWSKHLRMRLLRHVLLQSFSR